jgi:hypothetical protein
VEGSGISRVQCSFEINLDTSVLMLYDRSFGKSTEVWGVNAMPKFERKRERRVLLQKGLNTIIGMGGERRNLIQFELEWHLDPTQTAETIKKCNALSCGRVENLRFARTVDEAQTDLLSRREARLRTPGQRLRMRCVKVEGGNLGTGQFGTVYKVIDVDSEELMALKILKQPTKQAKKKDWK